MFNYLQVHKKLYLHFSIKCFLINLIPLPSCSEIDVESSGMRYNLIAEMPIIWG